MSSFNVETVSTKPYDGQKPGTSGLRKKVTVFQQPNYLANFVQASFNALPAENVKGSTLVVSGDGRYFSEEATQIIVRIAAGNGVKRVLVGKDALISTPAVSAIIRNRRTSDGRKPYGAFILTASHNPGGKSGDFGIKYNCENGGPAPENLTNAIHKITETISEYKQASDLPEVDLSALGVHKFSGPDGEFEVEIIDGVEDWANLVKTIYDFDLLQKFIKREDFTFVLVLSCQSSLVGKLGRHDAMHGVAGPYAKRIYIDELGADPSCLLNCDPKDDFGGGHPDPNLTYAHDLVEQMGLGDHAPSQVPDFGAANDGDADRNMILGKRFFVTPSDSVAVIAANAEASIPYFSSGLKGVARSMPTSAALDVVAKKKGLKFFEVPTGWKFFGNLMDAGMCSVCGEESFGTGSDHVREKDGMWAVLAWLSILAKRNENSPVGSLVTVEDIVREHWKTYGRHFYCRYDYEEVSSDGANQLMAHLVSIQSSLDSINKDIESLGVGDYKVKEADEFSYKDPVDGSVSAHQGIRFLFSDGSRLVFRLSGTGSSGATIRMYIEQYTDDASKIDLDTKTALQPLVDIALKLSKMQEFTGRDAPTVIT
eukprot:jgi/Chlat1/4876/Chrsp31S08943